MSEDTPFETWRLANMRQVAVSPEILKLLALAFDGGRLSKREWAGLTEDEKQFFKAMGFSGIDIVESKLKEKNT
jgi:N-acetylglutamate synthase-like GNAT family acetyltransferase